MSVKSKNIHVLSTDKPSRLFYNVGGALLFTNYENRNGVNIYITSDEPAYPYAFHITNQEVLKVRAFGYKSLELYHDKGFSFSEHCKKIILTTDQDLINDGVQAIDEELLEWFVKNPSCEHVTVLQKGATTIIFPTPKNDIISDFIKKEEPKQETLEEFAKQEALKQYSEDTFGNLIVRKSIEKGAKWQQEYIGKSEFLQKLRATISDAEARRLIFEQF